MDRASKRCGGIKDAPMIRAALHSVVLLSVLAAAGAARGEGQALDSACQELPRSSLVVDAWHDTPTWNASSSLYELRAWARDRQVSSAELKAHPLLVVGNQVTHHVDVDSTTTEVAPGVFCATPRKTYIRIGFLDRWVKIAREAARPPAGNDCVVQALLAHGLRIAQIDDLVLVSIVNHFKDEYLIQLAALKRLPAATASEAAAIFGDRIRAFVDEIGRELVAERQKMIEATINTSDGLRGLGAQCDGAVARAEKVVLERFADAPRRGAGRFSSVRPGDVR